MSRKWRVNQGAFIRSFDLGSAVYGGGMSNLKNGGQWQHSSEQITILKVNIM